MNQVDVAVCSRSFSNNLTLRNELISKYNNVKFNDEGLSLKGESLHNFLKDAKKAIIGLEYLDEEILAGLNNLEVISKYGVGCNNINFEALRKFNVKFAWKGGVNKRSVAELAIGSILAQCRNLFNLNNEIKNGQWNPRPGVNLSGKTVGIVGLGNIGGEIAKLLQAFGCHIIAYDIKDIRDYCRDNGIAFLDLNTLVKSSDIITFHVPLTNQTSGMVNANLLSKMKEDVILANTCRGGVFNEKDLFDFLTTNKRASAFFDVFEEEPALDNPLFGLKNFFASPHIGGTTEESILAMGRSAIEGLEKGLEALEENFI